jgi:putative SOS response-associated peptidase YedK
MCSRFSQTLPPDAVRSYFGYRNQPNFAARYNIAPTQPIPVVRQTRERGREFVLMRWGLIPSWVKNPDEFSTLINARAETAAAKPAFRAAMKYRRCLIAADGFYEWTGTKGKKQPFYIRRADGDPIGFAGLWEHWQGADGSEVDSAVILTTDANAEVSRLHERMPVIIDSDDFDAWLDCDRVSAEDVQELLGPAPDGLLQTIEVHPKINNPRLDEPGLLEPLQADLL